MGPWIIPENSDLRKVLCHRFDLLGNLIELQPRRPGDDGKPMKIMGKSWGNFWKTQNLMWQTPSLMKKSFAKLSQIYHRCF
jgi:hypothetical protein